MTTEAKPTKAFVAEARQLADNIESDADPSLFKAQIMIRAACDRIDAYECLQKSTQERVAKLEEALDTYAQFSSNGEIAFVSGFLAQRALAKSAEKELK